jgi:hypothetical protein
MLGHDLPANLVDLVENRIRRPLTRSLVVLDGLLNERVALFARLAEIVLIERIRASVHRS